MFSLKSVLCEGLVYIWFTPPHVFMMELPPPPPPPQPSRSTSIIAIIFFCSSFPVSQTIFSLPLHYRKTHVCHLVLPYILDPVCSSAACPSCLLFFFFVQTGLKSPPFTFFLLPYQSLNDALLRLTFLQNHFQHVESLEKVKEKVIEKEDIARVTTQKL